MFDVDQSGIFNAGTGRSVSFATVAEHIANKHNAKINLIPMPENLKGQYQEYTCANLTNLNSVVDMQWINIEDYINGK